VSESLAVSLGGKEERSTAVLVVIEGRGTRALLF
jgi:hypothetical protein